MENTGSLASVPDGRKRRVSYFFEPEIGQPTNPSDMNSHGKTHELILTYDLQYNMEMCRPILAAVYFVLQRFHTPEYLQFLAYLTPITITDPFVEYNLRNRFKVEFMDLYGRKGPIYYGLFDYCRACVGGSLNAAEKLNRGEADIAINWSGGMHRAKRDRASGFSYVNDVVLAIDHLLTVFRRVLYIEISYRHGDAVEEAFYENDRVMTVSFHTVRDSLSFLPRNGDRRELYTLNAPLKDDLSDASLGSLFVPVINKAMEVYQPEVVVLLCGADSLNSDLDGGRFNLKIKGHGDCVQYIRSFNVPFMLLGGGGFNILHIPRCWCYETAVAIGLGERFEEALRVNEFHFKPNRQKDLNTPADIATIRNRLLMQLSQVNHVPSVQFHDTPSISQTIEPAEVDMEKRQVLRNLKRSKL